MVGKFKNQISKIKNTIQNLKFLIFTLSFYILIFTFFITPVHAQTPIPSTISPTSPLYTDLILHNMFHSFSCLAIGSSVIGQPCLTYQLAQNAQGAIQTVPVLSQVNLSGGVLGTTSSLIGLLYVNPPVRTVDYLASLGEQFGVVKEAHAQIAGSGAAVLNPIIKLWQVSRNIAYIIMIIIFVIIGLMVMFRQRINPQTVITAQAALPGLVLGLILITFSYFLAGLVSDSAFVGTNLVGAYFSTVRGDPQSQNLLQELDNPDPAKKENILTIFSRYVGIINKDNAADAVGTIWDKLDFGVQFNLRLIASAIVAQFALPIGELRGGVGQLIAAGVSALLVNLTPGGIVGFVLSLMAMFILIYALLRLLLRLINAYLNIIFLTISAPFHFLAAALPGRQGIATNWILNILAHALAFPAVLAVLYFVAFILGKSSGPLKVISEAGTNGDGSLMSVALAEEPVISIAGQAAFPLFAGMNLDFIRILLAFGALVALPAIPDVISRTIGRITQAGQLLGEEYGRGVAGGRGYFSQAAGTGPGFAQRVGNLADQPARYTEPIKDQFGNVTGQKWIETMGTEFGKPAPTMGTWSRIKASSGWKATLGRWVK